MDIVMSELPLHVSLGIDLQKSFVLQSTVKLALPEINYLRPAYFTLFKFMAKDRCKIIAAQP